MRVVLYAEGIGELGGGGGLQPAPGSPLLDEMLGPAHVLVRRCLEAESRIPPKAIQFVSPLRIGARLAKGSDLLSRESLRRLLTFPLAERRPDLAVVLVDADGDLSRQKMLEGYVADVPLSHVIGVAIQEFESWLVADVAALSTALRPGFSQTPAPESLGRREAKGLLIGWVQEQSDDKAKQRELRREIAKHANLDTIAKRCGAFEDFRRALREVSVARS